MRIVTIGLACFGLGMLVMWMILEVDFFVRDGARSPEELARAGFDALRSGDFESFVQHVPDEEDLQTMLDQIRAEATEDGFKKVKRRMERDGGLSGMAEKHMDANRRRFATTLERTRAAGLDWDSAEFLGVDETRSRLSEKWGIMGGDVRFRVRAGGVVYDFKLDNCAGPGGVWTCGSGIRFYETAERVHVVQPDRVESTIERPGEPVTLPEPEMGAEAPVEVTPLPKPSK